MMELYSARAEGPAQPPKSETGTEGLLRKTFLATGLGWTFFGVAFLTAFFATFFATFFGATLFGATFFATFFDATFFATFFGAAVPRLRNMLGPATLVCGTRPTAGGTNAAVIDREHNKRRSFMVV